MASSLLNIMCSSALWSNPSGVVVVALHWFERNALTRWWRERWKMLAPHALQKKQCVGFLWENLLAWICLGSCAGGYHHCKTGQAFALFHRFSRLEDCKFVTELHRSGSLQHASSGTWAESSVWEKDCGADANVAKGWQWRRPGHTHILMLKPEFLAAKVTITEIMASARYKTICQIGSIIPRPVMRTHGVCARERRGGG